MTISEKRALGAAEMYAYRIVLLLNQYEDAVLADDIPEPVAEKLRAIRESANDAFLTIRNIRNQVRA